jgi:hypothetical protein
MAITALIAATTELGVCSFGMVRSALSARAALVSERLAEIGRIEQTGRAASCGPPFLCQPHAPEGAGPLYHNLIRVH